jgi:hypothetical protein
LLSFSFAVRLTAAVFEDLANYSSFVVTQDRALQPYLQSGGREEREFSAAAFALTAVQAI